MLVPEHLARDPKINAELQLVPECISQNMPNNSLNIVPESLENPKYPSISPTSSPKSPKKQQHKWNIMEILKIPAGKLT